MPGPMNPIGDLFANLGTALRQHRHPVWNAHGEKIGSYDTLDAMCAGQWYIYEGVKQPPVNELYVMDFWGRRVPLSTQCVNAAKATAKGGGITQPQPVQPANAAKAVANANAAATGSPATIIPDEIIPQGAGITQAQLNGWLIVGGITLAAVWLARR